MFRFNPQHVAKDKLGKGGFGVVIPYKRNQDDKRWVVKKSQVSHKDLPYAIAEIVHGFRCKHPNLLPAKGFHLEPHGIDLSGNFKEWNVVIKLPRMKDESLGGKIRRYRSDNQPFYEKEVLKLFYEIASGLKYLHENKIAHRDLKPDNVLFNHEDIAVLSDFGFSTFTEDETGYTPREEAGTKPYAAPEVHLCKTPRTQPKLKKRGLYPADIWSFGVLMFEVCSSLGANNEGTGEERQEKFKNDIEKLNYSSFFKGLLLQMLRSEPTQRIKINDLWEKLEEKIKGTSKNTEMVVEDELLSLLNNGNEKGGMQVEESKGEALNDRLKPGEFRGYEEDDRGTSVLSVRDELRKDYGDLFEFEADGIDQSLKVTSKQSILNARNDIVNDEMLGDLLGKLTTEVVGKNCRKFKEFSLALTTSCNGIKGSSLAELFGANQIGLEKLELDLSGTSVNNNGLKELASQISKNLKNLQDLRLTFPSKTKGSGVESLTEEVFSSLKNLKRVELFSGLRKTDHELKEIGNHISNNLADLEHLALGFYPLDSSDPQFPEKGFKDLFVPIVSSCKKLKHLDLSFATTMLARTGVKELLAVEAVNLQHLRLNFNLCIKMKNQGAIEIANYVFPQLKNLNHLDLDFSQCRVNDDGVFILIEKISHTLPDLKHLILSFASAPMITAEGILKIADPIKSHLKNLESLHLDFDKCNGDKEEKKKVKEELGSLSSVIKDVVIKIS